MSDRSEHISGTTCFLMGLAVGGAAALLLAPRSGRETRDQIQGEVRKGKEKIASGAGYVSGKAREAATTIKDKSHEAVETGKRWVGKKSDEAGVAVDEYSS